MSDFEMITIFNESLNTVILIFTTFVSIVFGFLVASTLAGRLTRLMTGIAVGLFTGASVCLVVLSSRILIDVGNLANVIRTEVDAGTSTLGWIGFAQGSGPIGLIFQAIPLLMLASYVAALVFFFHQQRIARLTQAVPSPQPDEAAPARAPLRNTVLRYDDPLAPAISPDE